MLSDVHVIWDPPHAVGGFEGHVGDGAGQAIFTVRAGTARDIRLIDHPTPLPFRWVCFTHHGAVVFAED